MNEIEKAQLLITAISNELSRGTLHIRRSDNVILFDIKQILMAMYDNDLDVVFKELKK